MSASFSKFIIPGFTMHKKEFPELHDVMCLQNPEVGTIEVWKQSYSLKDVAEYHLETILKLLTPNKPLKILGMSMGGMILSILGSIYRDKLPKETQFIFLVTSMNSDNMPAITDIQWQEWMNVGFGDVSSFEKALTPFFSPDFVKNNPEAALDYFQYKAFGKNEQTPQSIFKQGVAVMQFNGEKYFTKLKDEECIFYHGEDDLIFDQNHQKHLKANLPEAIHKVIPNCGHMVTIERPDFFKEIL